MPQLAAGEHPSTVSMWVNEQSEMDRTSTASSHEPSCSHGVRLLAGTLSRFISFPFEYKIPPLGPQAAKLKAHFEAEEHLPDLQALFILRG